MLVKLTPDQWIVVFIFRFASCLHFIRNVVSVVDAVAVVVLAVVAHFKKVIDCCQTLLS